LSNIKSTKRNEAVFLAAVLVAGIFAAISPSFIIGVNAQYDPQYGMDTRHSSYEPESEDRDKGYYSYEPGYPKSPDQPYNSYGHEYSPEYKDKEFNSYEPDPYEMDKDRKSYVNDNSYDNKKSYETNSYEPTTTSYGNDNNYQKNYENDNSYDKSQYQSSSYQPDYKPEYPSYGKDDRDKSKKDSSSVSINKLNCINNNVNINGNNTGDINVGNSGSSATGPGTDEGYLGDYSSGSGYDGEGYSGYDNGYNKQKGESITCLINNNNINSNFGAGNATDGIATEPQTCEECFRAFLTQVQISAYLQTVNPPSPPTLEQFCNDVGPGSTFDLSESGFRTALAGAADVEFEVIDALIVCLENVGVEFSA
jgi:hypothetical protein